MEPVGAEAHAQGKRPTMEDATVVDNRSQVWGVFDGHGGPDVANLAAARLVKDWNNPPWVPEHTPKDTLKRIGNTLVSLDFDVEGMGLTGWKQGSTAAVVVYDPRIKLFGAKYLGDTRVLRLYKKRGIFGIGPDHTLSNHAERARIISAGGAQAVFVAPDGSEYVSADGSLVPDNIAARIRPYNKIAVTRALGDFVFKGLPSTGVNGSYPSEQLILNESEGQAWSREDDLYWVIIACDGVFQRMTNGNVYHKMMEWPDCGGCNGDPTAASQFLVKAALDSGSTDNISVVAIYVPASTPEKERARRAEKPVMPDWIQVISDGDGLPPMPWTEWSKKRHMPSSSSSSSSSSPDSRSNLRSKPATITLEDLSHTVDLDELLAGKSMSLQQRADVIYAEHEKAAQAMLDRIRAMERDLKMLRDQLADDVSKLHRELNALPKSK